LDRWDRWVHLGEPLTASRPERGEYKGSGFKVDVSDASWEGLRDPRRGGSKDPRLLTHSPYPSHPSYPS